MNTRATPPTVEVRIWGQGVGSVAADPQRDCQVFTWDPAWRRTGIELAPLTMPLAGGDRFAFPDLSTASYRGLPGMLADALPDDFGNALIDAWMNSKGIPETAINALDRLAFIGRRGLGALEFKPARGAPRESAEALQLRSLVEVARRVLDGDLARGAGGDRLARSALARLTRVGTSAGGARAKAAVAWNPHTGALRSGQLDVDAGFEHWLLKFDGVGEANGGEGGRIEYAYAQMAGAAGITMSPCRLLEENGRAHFMTRRFDRQVAGEHSARHHLQTLCGIDHVDYKLRRTHAYARLFAVIDRLGLGPLAVGQAFRRMAFNVMARNCDDHSKNFSFRLKQGGEWELAPAYDLTHAHNPRGQWTRQHQLSINGRFEGITRADLLIEAERFGVLRAFDVLADVRDALVCWPRFARDAGLGAASAAAVGGDFLPL